MKVMNAVMPKKVRIVLLMLFSTTILIQGQYRLNIGLGVSDIGFQLGGEAAYFGYELASIEHHLPAFFIFTILMNKSVYHQGRLYKLVKYQALKGIQ